MTPLQTIILEVAKLITQFVGAIVIARLAVTWALNRYKSEKTWERRLAAYVDVVSALSEMRLIVGRWYDEVILRHDVPSEQDAAQRERYQVSKRRFDEGIAAALLLLPKEVSESLSEIERGIERSRKGVSEEEDLDNLYGVLDDGLKRLVVNGRRILGVAASDL
jgi:hypothetical protein